MAGYTRQSVADIINGLDVTAPPLNAEFNQVAAAFNASTGHIHDGSNGNAPQIPLATSVSGFLLAVNGGVGGRNNTAATTNPTTSADNTQNYAPGSIWLNTSTGRVFRCVGNATGAAVWREVVQISEVNVLAPETTNTVDLGTTAVRFRNLFLSGTATVAGNTSIGGTLNVSGSTALSSTLAVTGLSTLATVDINGGNIDGTVIGAATRAAGNFTTISTTGLVTFASADINGGTIDGAVIGGASATTVTGTNITATTGFSGDLTGSVTGNVTGNLTGNVTGNVAGNVAGNVTSTGTSTFQNVTINGSLDLNAGTAATVTGLSAPVNGTDATTKTYVDAADATKLNLSGGTMSGVIAMGTNKITGLGTPVNAADAATKGYVDTSVSNLIDAAPGALDTLNELASALGDDPNFSTTITNSIATKLPLAGGTMTGDITLGANKATSTATPTANDDLTRKGYVDTQVGTRLPLAGGTMTGAIAMGNSKITGLGTPTAGTDATTKTYVDGQDATKLNLSGGTMTGGIVMGANKITSTATPTVADDLTRKGYVDGILGSATSAANSAAAASTSATNAANSASAASTSETNASSSASAAAASFDEFDYRYLGAKASAPSVDNDGNALLTGALYWNTTSNSLFVWNGSQWSAAAFDSSGALVAVNNLSDVADVATARTNLGLAIVRTPVITSPTAGETGVLPTPTIVGGPYASLYSADARAHRLFQIDLASGDFSAPVVSEQVNADSFTVASNLALETNHKVRIKDVSVTGAESAFSDVITFQTANITVNAPTLTVEGAPTEVPETPTLTTGAFSTTPTDEDTHASTNWIVRLAADDSIVYQSLADTVNLLTIVVPEGNLLVDTEYKFQAQHVGTTFGASAVTEVVATTLDAFEPAIGDAFGGGFFTGEIWLNGGELYRLVVAPKASGESTSQQFKTTNTASPADNQTLNNGLKSTTAMVAAGSHPAAAFCDGLTIGGFSDWYLPARDELELLYRNLKPTTSANNTGAITLSAITYPEGNDVSGDTHGVNRNSNPTGAAYTSGNPAQTSVTAFVTGGTEAFASTTYFSSSEFSDTNAWRQGFSDGNQTSTSKGTSRHVRAVRRELVSPNIGDFIYGGYFGGTIYEGGVPYYLIVAPKASGENTSIQYKTTNTASPAATQTLNDGATATAAMVAAGDHPAAAFCAGLTINGFSDWYMPARDELEILYRTLKPTTDANNTSNRALSTITYPEGNDISTDTMGFNRNSVNINTGYTSGYPARTGLALFQTGGAEAFASTIYFSSSEFSVTNAWTQLFSIGFQLLNAKVNSNHVRAVRRLAV